jgi:hydroxypyruvate isomerase
MTDILDRRSFVGSVAAAAAALAAKPIIAGAETIATSEPRKFKLKYAPHFGMFRAHAGEDLVAQLEFMRDEGFAALEDNGMKGRSVADQERVAKAMQRLGMEMGVFVGHTIDWNNPLLSGGDPALRDKFLQEIRESVDVAKRVNTRYMVVVPGVADRRRDPELQMVNVLETLRRAVAILEPHNLTMLIETLNTRVNHPGQLLPRAPQIYLITRALNTPACKIQYDIYHEQINGGHIIPTLDAVWSDVAYIQVGDTPGRKEPGTGEINYRNIFDHLKKKGYTGIVGMEHGNSKPGKEGERAVIDAYIAADGGA